MCICVCVCGGVCVLDNQLQRASSYESWYLMTCMLRSPSQVPAQYISGSVRGGGGTLQLLKPSPNRVISAMRVESGTTMEMGLNMDFRLSGSSVRPA